MIRHLVTFRWTDEATQDQKERVATELSRLPAIVPTVRAYRIGHDLGLNEGNFDFAVAADFDDADGYLAYRDNPEHQAIIAEFIRPIIAQRAAIQYEY
jgi:hypothetical protein